MKNIALAIGKDNRIDQRNKILSGSGELTDSKKKVSITQAEFQNIPAENLEAFKKEIFKNKEIDEDCRKVILAVLDARYIPTEDEYEKSLNDWKKCKKKFSQKVQDAISLAANIASVGAFIGQLMAL